LGRGWPRGTVSQTPTPDPSPQGGGEKAASKIFVSCRITPVSFVLGLCITNPSKETRDEHWFRQTLCFRKINGAWTIVHEHESVPFYMDGSFRAAIDLKP
jgi:SnoaL-like domain